MGFLSNPLWKEKGLWGLMCEMCDQYPGQKETARLPGPSISSVSQYRKGKVSYCDLYPVIVLTSCEVIYVSICLLEGSTPPPPTLSLFSLSLYVSLPLSLWRFLSLFHSLTLSLSLPLPHSLSLSLTHTRSLRVALSRPLSLSLSLHLGYNCLTNSIALQRVGLNV